MRLYRSGKHLRYGVMVASLFESTLAHVHAGSPALHYF